MNIKDWWTISDYLGNYLWMKSFSKGNFVLRFISFELKVRIFQNENMYEVVALPKIWTKKLEKFCPDTFPFFVHVLGNVRISYLILKFPDL
jgi:hypothetical protein